MTVHDVGDFAAFVELDIEMPVAGAVVLVLAVDVDIGRAIAVQVDSFDAAFIEAVIGAEAPAVDHFQKLSLDRPLILAVGRVPLLRHTFALLVVKVRVVNMVAPSTAAILGRNKKMTFAISCLVE